MRLNLLAPINQLGYGVASVNFLKELTEENHEVALFPIGNQIESAPVYHDAIKRALKNAEKFDATAPSLKIWHQNDLAMHVGLGFHVAFPFFELDRFTELEKRHLNSQNLIIVASEWAKSVVEKELCHDNSSDWCKVVPLGVDTKLFCQPMEKSTNRNTVFLNVGKWEVRKGHDVLVDAFNKAFGSNDAVELWTLCWNPFLQPVTNNGKDGNLEWSSHYKNSPLGEKITVWHRMPSHDHVARLMATADCGVFPARAEGWNLELLEMMSCGKQVIATNYAAHTEFCSPDNCHLIDCDEKEDAYDGKWFYRQGQWAAFGDDQMDSLVAHMRSIHERKQNGDNLFNAAGRRTAEEYTWKNAARKLASTLSSFSSG